MSFASDKLANGYLRRNLSTLVNRVKAREIIIHLPCLTAHDRENIEAKREICGNYDAMMLLLECLKRRENWPEQLIEALEACEQPSIAAEIRAEYNALRGGNSSSPGSPSTTVVRAHVHPAPPADHVSLPGTGGNAQVAAAMPAAPSAPPKPAAQASPTLETPVHPQAQGSAAHVPGAVSPPEPVPKPPQLAQIKVMPPPSPETPHTPASTPPQTRVNAHQEPEENSESDIQDIAVDNGLSPDRVNTGKSEVSSNSVASPQMSRPVEQCATGALSNPNPVQTTTTTTTTAAAAGTTVVRPTQANSDVTDGSSFPTRTSERPPVQDTTPPVEEIPTVVLEPEETSEPPAWGVESSPQAKTAATASPLPGAAGMDTSVFEESTLCLSKPGQLISIQPHNHGNSAAHSPPSEPYSGNTERLAFSEAAPDAVTSAHIPACSAVTSAATVTTVSGLLCQENGLALDPNEPEENHYESPCQSLEMQEVQVSVGHVYEEPSILNLDGQISAPRVQNINGEAARVITPSPPSSSTNAADTVSSLNPPSSQSHHPSKPTPADVKRGLKTLPESEEKTASRTQLTKYILTAAGVGACALLMALRFKK